MAFKLDFHMLPAKICVLSGCIYCEKQLHISFFDAKYCFRQRAALSRLHSQKEIKNSPRCNENSFLMFLSLCVPEIQENQTLQR